MKLFYSPGACSLAPHIVLRETGTDFDLVKVDFANKKTEHGDDFTQINPHGYVPAIQLDNNDTLTEGVAIMQYLADSSPESGLVPENGTFERAKLHERLNYLTSEFHKGLFSDVSDEEKKRAVANVESKLDYLDNLLSKQDYLMGDKFSIADIYMFVIASWTAHTGIDLKKWSNISAYSEKITNRKSVQEAKRAEGLIS
ncbi:MAG: glutathione transferase GstA [Cocleimonas sp.]